MRDRISTKILGNGATRYGVYDEDGNLLRYEYIKLEDEPDEEGSLWNKANVLPDHIPALLGLKMGNPQVKDALNVLANIGNVHVWSQTIKIAADVPATYYLDVAAQLSVGVPPAGTGISRSVTYSESVSVADDGTVALSGTPTTATLYFSMGQPAPSEILGKYFLLDSALYFCPSDATCISNGYATPSVMLVSPQRVVGVAMIPAGTHTDFVTSTDSTAYPRDGDVGDCHYTYLGQLGGGARIEVGSYVGTGKYGASNPNSIPIKKTTKLVIVQAADHTKLGGFGYFWMLCIRGNTTSTLSSPNTSNLAKYVNTLEWDEETLSWYNDNYGFDQLNASGVMYKYIAIG